MATLRDLDLDGLIAIGGEDTLGVANQLAGRGAPIVGVPRPSTTTFGHRGDVRVDTAVQIATEAIDRLRTTAESIIGS